MVYYSNIGVKLTGYWCFILYNFQRRMVRCHEIESIIAVNRLCNALFFELQCKPYSSSNLKNYSQINYREIYQDFLFTVLCELKLQGQFPLTKLGYRKWVLWTFREKDIFVFSFFNKEWIRLKKSLMSFCFFQQNLIQKCVPKIIIPTPDRKKKFVKLGEVRQSSF